MMKIFRGSLGITTLVLFGSTVFAQVAYSNFCSCFDPKDTDETVCTAQCQTFEDACCGCGTVKSKCVCCPESSSVCQSGRTSKKVGFAKCIKSAEI